VGHRGPRAPAVGLPSPSPGTKSALPCATGKFADYASARIFLRRRAHLSTCVIGMGRKTSSRACAPPSISAATASASLRMDRQRHARHHNYVCFVHGLNQGKPPASTSSFRAITGFAKPPAMASGDVIVDGPHELAGERPIQLLRLTIGLYPRRPGAPARRGRRSNRIVVARLKVDKQAAASRTSPPRRCTLATHPQLASNEADSRRTRIRPAPGSTSASWPTTCGEDQS